MSYRASSCGDVCRAELQEACRRGGGASPTLQSMTKTRALALKSLVEFSCREQSVWRTSGADSIGGCVGLDAHSTISGHPELTKIAFSLAHYTSVSSYLHETCRRAYWL
jgi:hypothetical protein